MSEIPCRCVDCPGGCVQGLIDGIPCYGFPGKRGPCPTCNGTGRVQPPVTDEQVERALAEWYGQSWSDWPKYKKGWTKDELNEEVTEMSAAINAYREAPHE